MEKTNSKTNQKKNLRKTRSLTKSILQNSFNVSTFVFAGLAQFGELTVNAFLNPSIYADMPSGSFGYIVKTKKQPALKEMTIRQSIRRLQKQGFVEKVNDKYRFTKSGKNLAEYIKNRKKSVEGKWDGKYRVVIFDIPEKIRKDRDWLRQELYMLNYKQLQKSVFVSKCSLTKDLIKEIKRRKMGNCINYILAERIYKNFSN